MWGIESNLAIEYDEGVGKACEEIGKPLNNVWKTTTLSSSFPFVWINYGFSLNEGSI